MHLTIEHSTRYVYDAPVDYSIQQLRLTPRDGFGQRVKRWHLRVNGQMQQHADAYGNAIHTLVVDRPHHEVTITACGEVETGLDLRPPPNACRCKCICAAPR
ncbi:transglutaminase N-terminal domain-containing protein [Methylogaea oryzae]|uniref:transglutaminase N-terminal domain-containing protein n=1 Tax=Methylogaea oryzae TaxID=1295382 RepID=UPI0006D05B33|nr:transglutaminase N-terminal domain-containing protein [Methylogaea oryzae]